jgi:hypothetical protein
MPLVVIFFWAAVIGLVWFWCSPRTFGRFIGGKFLKATNGEPKKIAGAQILSLFVVGLVLTIVFWNVHPLTIFPIWFVWFKLFQKMTISKKASSNSESKSA